MQSVLVEGMIEKVAALTLEKFANMNLNANQLAISLIVLEDGASACADFRGNEKFYPASVVKLFYLVAAHQWLKDGKIKETDELKRAMKDMIVDSSNDATHYILDVLTGTTSGPALSPAEMQEWLKKRNVVNEYFAAQGYKNINLNQKTWGDGPYGRERAALRENYKNCNILTANTTARLLSEIAMHKCISESCSEEILTLLKRDFTKYSEDPDDQATCFSGRYLNKGCRLWSKAGWTSTARHDAAYIERPDGKRFILVVFTADYAKNHDIIPFVASEVNKQL